MTRSPFLRPLASGILGITFMLPACYFLLTLLARICFGAKTMYYYFSPSFLQSPFDLFALHKAQLIIGCLLLAVLFNVAAIIKLRLHKGPEGLEVGVAYRRYWLNTAIALQSVLLLLVLIVYTFIQHIRY
ncbi:hypothetical protein [Puia dinghuensis]|uniref:DUF4149 domain-containing protein n=1 Tax=Puia dinghuensis TaxID=1792502 RepID=A0A8J2XV31_9BACT|nr:hypothetical protein [Puia dinghuensis]GGB14130.1 hypothetical protein GCM10011511_42360 [Puia dinghuensis]